MAQKKKNKGKDDSFAYYSHILIHQGKKMIFLTLILGVLITITFIITQTIYTERSWRQLVFPILILGLPLMLYPAIEEWVYKPWQSKPQKYERHYRD